MGFEQRNFTGQFHRPRPDFFTDSNNELFIVATPWGPRKVARRTVEIIQDFVLSAKGDKESTSPFDKLTCLSPAGNIIRSAIKLANDTIYHENNKDEFTCGVEVLVMLKFGHELFWSQVGHHQVFLDRSHQLNPLETSIDLSEQLTTKQALPTLPQEMLGLHSSSNFAIRSLRLQKQDRVILMQGSNILKIPSFLNLTETSIDSISGELLQQGYDQSYWVGTIDF